MARADFRTFQAQAGIDPANFTAHNRANAWPHRDVTDNLLWMAVLELAVNWEAEKLYGVENMGPFDEF